MILANIITPVLILCLIFLYGVLCWRYFRIREKLPFMWIKDGLRNIVGSRRYLAVLGMVVFLVSFAGQMYVRLWTLDMRMIFHYEEAARGQNPNGTRFNASDILSNEILEKVIARGGFTLSPEELSACLTLSTPLDEQTLDTSKESNLKISTEYWIHCSEAISLYHIKPKTVLELLADVYWESFVHDYAENDRILDLSFDELEKMEYLDIKDFFFMQASKLRNYLPGYSRDSSSFRSKESGETFASLSRKIENYIDIELERYKAFVLENGLSRDKASYQSRIQYVNRILEVSRSKNMAAHDVRIETINMYNALMTRFVLIPTYDTGEEFYMSRTKIGVDYFADEAKEHLETATRLMKEMEHNKYASAQIGGSRAMDDAYAQADRQVDTLRKELIELSAQCRQLCSEYIREKRDGYIQMSYSSSSVTENATDSLLLAAFFVIAGSGMVMLAPFYKEVYIEKLQEAELSKGEVHHERA